MVQAEELGTVRTSQKPQLRYEPFWAKEAGSLSVALFFRSRFFLLGARRGARLRDAAVDDSRKAGSGVQ